MLLQNKSLHQGIFEKNINVGHTSDQCCSFPLCINNKKLLVYSCMHVLFVYMSSNIHFYSI